MKKYFLMGLFFFSLVSCQREIDKYYEIPDWLKGNAYEVMEDRGNFSIFMKVKNLLIRVCPRDYGVLLRFLLKFLWTFGTSEVFTISLTDCSIL